MLGLAEYRPTSSSQKDGEEGRARSGTQPGSQSPTQWFSLSQSKSHTLSQAERGVSTNSSQLNQHSQRGHGVAELDSIVVNSGMKFTRIRKILVTSGVFALVLLTLALWLHAKYNWTAAAGLGTNMMCPLENPSKEKLVDSCPVENPLLQGTIVIELCPSDDDGTQHEGRERLWELLVCLLENQLCAPCCFSKIRDFFNFL